MVRLYLNGNTNNILWKQVHVFKYIINIRIFISKKYQIGSFK